MYSTDRLPPCKDCADRHAGCHAECEKYLSWKADHIAACEANRLSAGERAARDVLREGVLKNIRRNQRSCKKYKRSNRA